MILIYFYSFLLAFGALLYELLMARAVSLWAADNAVWYALAVGIFLGGMGLGAWRAGRGNEKIPAWRRLVTVECCLALAGGGSILLVDSAALGGLFLGLAGSEGWGKILFFGVALLSAVSVGIIAGMELPLLLTMAGGASAAAAGDREQDKTARVLLMDYAGALAAGIVFPLLLIPSMGVLTAAVLVSLMNAVAALWLLWYYKSAAGHKRVWLLLLFLSLFYCFSGRIEGYFASKYYFSFQDAAVSLSPAEFFKPRVYPGRVERLRSPYQLIDLVTVNDIGDKARGLLSAYIKADPRDNKDLEGTVLFLNHDFQFAVSFERIYHEAFVHIPMAVRGRVPKKVLVLGAGDGLLLREVLKYPGVEEVVLVDIDPLVLRLFKDVKVLAALNGNAFNDPRVRVVVADAYQFVRRSRDTFDMVFCDFPNPDDYDLAKLYSREFYTFAGNHLKPGGILVIDAPGLAHEEAKDQQGVWGILSNSLYSAGFKTITPFFSILQPDHPAALALLEGDSDALSGYLDGLTSGFVMAARENVSLASPAGPLHVGGLRVMTDDRVRLGLTAANQYVLQINPSRVNSVFCPLFPLRRDAGKIRRAY